MANEIKKRILKHTDLEVYQKAFAAAMKIFELSKNFPVEERYSLTDQIRRSSRSVCANLAEAWRKRRYEGAWISKLSDCEAEAAETQTWLQFVNACEYADRAIVAELYLQYEEIIKKLVKMINSYEDWQEFPVSHRHKGFPSCDAARNWSGADTWFSGVGSHKFVGVVTRPFGCRGKRVKRRAATLVAPA